MKRLALIAAAALGVVLLVALVTVGGLYWQATASVPEYEAALAVSPESVAEERQAFESQVASLYSDSQAAGEWSTRVTAAQVNAWLAERLAETFPELAKSGVVEPRLVIGDNRLTIATRARVGRVDGVLTIDLRPFLSGDGDLSVAVEGAKMGRLALPVAGIAAQAREAGLERVAPVRFTQGESETVVTIDLARLAGDDITMRLTGIDLRAGELLLRGVSEVVERVPDEQIDPADEPSSR